MKDLVEYVAKSLVEDPDAVVVQETQRKDRVTLELSVASNDMGRVIGKNGRVANAIRSLLRVMGNRDGVQVDLEIE